MADFIRLTGKGDAATHFCAQELGLSNSRAHHDTAHLVDRTYEQMDNGGIENPNHEPLFTPELAHNALVSPTHYRNMRDMMQCGLETQGYGRDMVNLFHGMYDEAIGTDAVRHAAGGTHP